MNHERSSDLSGEVYSRFSSSRAEDRESSGERRMIDPFRNEGSAVNLKGIWPRRAPKA